MADLATAFETIRTTMQADSEYAWAWQCNIAVPMIDAIGLSQAKANEAAALVMAQMFGVDITANPHYRWGKSGAQSYFETRVANGG